MGDNKPASNKPRTRRAPIRLRSIVSGPEWLETLLSGLPEQGLGERELLIRNSYRVAESDYGRKPAGFDDTGLRSLACFERDQLLFWPWVAVIELSVDNSAREGWGKAELNRLLTRVFGAAESLRVRFYRRSEERFLVRAIDQTELIDRLEWMRACLAEEGGDRGGHSAALPGDALWVGS
ncbi:hypothetical protein [Aestuariirhabdus litorea]|uniref:Uncharacterized protein n=1 Tax=Aestuariirhabdus litorea TaxID=2528527 RepID=A0A3P3VNQ2_9GAMM|nr:hypothetical protein [Aestuariirhabdus litorea]RRJ84240.1 hypothetical protein D0544_03780 [Aestuariirhabdus litorea]RWW97462.1 hypothetical protein DZC74_03780 [Endozoicomonadaceae bacterium GTF-13]